MTVRRGLFSAVFGCLEILRLIFSKADAPYRANIYPIPFLRLWRRMAHLPRLFSGHPGRGRVFVVGEMDEGRTGRMRMEAMKKLFGEVGSLNTRPWTEELPIGKRLMTNHLYAGDVLREFNRAFREQVRRFHPDVLWVEKGLHVYSDTLTAIGEEVRPFLINYSSDNQRMFQNQSRHYLMSVAFYDLHVTTKRHCIRWLEQCGARRVEFMKQGFDPKVHRPMDLTPAEMEKYGCDVGFVGHWEPDREETLFYLWEKGYRLKVWGGDWRRAKRRRHPLFRDSCHLAGEEYVKALCATRINLGFLSVRADDQTTSRSMEIPACGGFLLAERTAEHTELFREGTEAEFYDTREEMRRKIDQYLLHVERREAVARAGRARCLAGYSYEDRLRDLFARVWG